MFFIGITLFAFIGMIGGTGCANIIPPTGGPRDSLPPRLISSNPADSIANFKGKKISFVFNEYVQLENIQENLLVSPYPKINPTVQSKLREVTVTIRDTLEPNTTYAINFGNAIRDVNEGNPYKNFTYLFSTGNTLDSLQISGKVILAENGKTDSTLIAVLHTDFADSAVKERPRYVTRVDANGIFTFRNLPPATYALYAFKDEGGSRRYTSASQLFAFADTLVSSVAPPDSMVLFAYLEKDTVKEIRRQPPPRPAALKGNAAIADRLLRVLTSLTNNQLGLLASDTLQLRFPLAPLVRFDSTKMVFTNEKFEPITDYRIVRDTGNKQISIFYPWTENTGYNIILDKEFAEDSSGRKIPRTDTITFRTKKETEYGLVRIRFLNLNLGKNPVLQFVQNDDVVFAHVFNESREFYARLFNPGEYDLRILYDENKNGVWDPGNFFGEHKQPEIAVPVSRKAVIKNNIDNEFDITL